MTPPKQRSSKGGGKSSSPRSARGAKGPSKSAGKSRTRVGGKGKAVPASPRPRRAPLADTSGAKRGGPRRSTPSGVGGEQVEGIHAVRELLLAGRRKVREVLVATDRRDGSETTDLADLAADLGVAVTMTTTTKLARVARTEAHQGVVAIADELPEVDLDELVARSGPAAFLLILDGVTDPGNLGALLRTAECTGVTGVVLPRHRAAHVTPAATKSAAGAIEHLAIALVGGIPSAMNKLKDAGVWVVGLDMAGGTAVNDLPELEGPVALVLGSEGKGLSRLVRERCDVVVSIPLRGRLQSLNVAAAGAIACNEVARARSRKS